MSAGAVFVLALSSCASPPPKVVGDDGWSPALGQGATPPPPPRPPAPRARTTPPDERKLWARADVVATLEEVGGRGHSEHEGGKLDRRVYVNPAAAGYAALTAGAQLPVGALLLQWHYPAGSNDAVSAYVMHKTTAGWSYLVLDPALRVAASGPLAACARCHDDSPHDQLFGPAPPSP